MKSFLEFINEETLDEVVLDTKMHKSGIKLHLIHNTDGSRHILATHPGKKPKIVATGPAKHISNQWKAIHEGVEELTLESLEDDIVETAEGSDV